MSVKKETDQPIMAVMDKPLREMVDMKNKEHKGYIDKQGRGEIMSELLAKQTLLSERLIRNYKRWRIIILSVICFVMLFILAFLITMFICKEDC